MTEVLQMPEDDKSSVDSSASDTGIARQSDEETRKEINRAKKLAKKARSQALEAERKARNAAKKADQQRAAFALQQSIVDGWVVDETGKRIRKYSLAEKLIDNKVIGYGIGFGFIFLCVGLFVFLYSINR
jgi:uncharacterized iron-regulated protein